MALAAARADEAREEPAAPTVQSVLRGFLRPAAAELKATSAALAENPSDADLALKAARIRLEIGFALKAAEVLDECAKASGGNFELFREGGWLLLEAGLCDEASRWLTQAVALASGPDKRSVLGLRRAIDGMVQDALDGLPPAGRRRHLEGVERLVRNQPGRAGHAFAAAIGRRGFAPAWLGLRGALEAQGRKEEAAALEARWLRAAPDRAPAIRAAMTRKLSARGLPFDPREPMALRPAGESFAEVADVTALGSGGDRILMLERGGQKTTLEPVIPLAAFGEQRTRFIYKRGAKFVAALEAGAVVERGIVLNSRGELQAETLPPCSIKKAGFNVVEGQVVAELRRFRDGGCPVQVWDTPALLMANPVDAGFGDWFLNIPDRRALAEAAGLDLDLPLVLRRATPEGYVKVLESLGWDRRRIIRPDPQGISIFPRLYTTSWPLQQRSAPIKDLFGVFKRTLGRRTLPPGKGERIFISREGIWKRPLTNEPEIRAIFERRGFRVVRPELLSLPETRDLFANADIVGGAYGSAYMNFAYAPEPPTAMVLMPPETEHFLDEIALWLGACGARFAYLFGDPAPGRDKRAPWTAPAAQVEAGLDELLAQLGKA